MSKKDEDVYYYFRKPSKCKVCGGKLIEIFYIDTEITPALQKQIDNNKMLILREEDKAKIFQEDGLIYSYPDYSCVECGTKYARKTEKEGNRNWSAKRKRKG